MPAYFASDFKNIKLISNNEILGMLQKHSSKEFQQTLSTQTSSWEIELNLIKQTIGILHEKFLDTDNWAILFEYPMPRLRTRMDLVILARDIVIVIEFKIGALKYDAYAIRQVEDYALDLIDFHKETRGKKVVPVLCVPGAAANWDWQPEERIHQPILFANELNFADQITRIVNELTTDSHKQINGKSWDRSEYSPIPTIIEAAEHLYSGHAVEEIMHASSDVKNLSETTDALVNLIYDAKQTGRRYVVFVTGTPGSGKTLTGLNAAHDARFRKSDLPGGTYLTGTRPIAEVLREALARDLHRTQKTPIADCRKKFRHSIQTLLGFLETYFDNDNVPPENVIVVDEAQRCWNALYGKRKFDRPASEAELLLRIMERHTDWSVIIALVGGGQEINTGEAGLGEWGDSIIRRNRELENPWICCCSRNINGLGPNYLLTAHEDASGLPTKYFDNLHLHTSVRSHISHLVNDWVEAVLRLDLESAKEIAHSDSEWPIYYTRSLTSTRSWLRRKTVGNRRSGLVASSGARRLRAEGLGVNLNTQDLDEVKNWFLQPTGDIRSSNQLEICAIEYTCQGLELDFVGLCWGNDLMYDDGNRQWICRRFSGNNWQIVRRSNDQKLILNKYRVLLTRARKQMIIWIPEGSSEDKTNLHSDYRSLHSILNSALPEKNFVNW